MKGKIRTRIFGGAQSRARTRERVGEVGARSKMESHPGVSGLKNSRTKEVLAGFMLSVVSAGEKQTV